MTRHGYLGAFITKVKKGSIADTVGHLHAGKSLDRCWGGASPNLQCKSVKFCSQLQVLYLLCNILQGTANFPSFLVIP